VLYIYSTPKLSSPWERKNWGACIFKNLFVALQAMPQVVIVVVGMSVLTYLGVIKFVVETLGRVLAFCLDISPAEGINAIGNIFLHVVHELLL